jgi:hypothetical protein
MWQRAIAISATEFNPNSQIRMIKRPLISHSWLTALLLVVPTTVLSTPQSTAPPEAVTLESDGKLIAQLPDFPIHQLANFDPSVDGFQFKNLDLTNTISPNLDQAEWQSYLSNSVQWMFGTNKVCLYGEAETCVLTSPARRWMEAQIQSMSNGICEGMAAASLYLWLAGQAIDHPDERTYLYTSINKFFDPTTNTVSEINQNHFAFQQYIADLFVLQGIDQVDRYTRKIRETKTPKQILRRIINSMWTEDTTQIDPYTVGIYQVDPDNPQRLLNGHSLTPYKVVQIDEVTYRVYVYDSNYLYTTNTPDLETYLEFNIEQDIWNYQPPNATTRYVGDANSHNIDLTPLSKRTLDLEGPRAFFKCQFCGQPEDIEISLIGEGNLLITNGEGQQAGYDPAANQYFDDINGTSTSIFRGGLNKSVSPTYTLPADVSGKPYEIVVSGADANDGVYADLVVTSGGFFTVGFQDIQLNPDDWFVMYLYTDPQGPALYFSADTNATESVTIPTVFVALEDTANQTSYLIEIGGMTLEPGKEVGVTVDTIDRRVYFSDNDTQDNAYDLTITTVRDTGDYQLEIPGVLVYSDEVAYFAYDEWRQADASNQSGDINFDDIPLYFWNVDEADASLYGSDWGDDSNALGNLDSGQFQESPSRNRNTQPQNRPPIGITAP